MHSRSQVATVCPSRVQNLILGINVGAQGVHPLDKLSRLLQTHAVTVQAVYTALKETESRSTDLLPLWKVLASLKDPHVFRICIVAAHADELSQRGQAGGIKSCVTRIHLHDRENRTLHCMWITLGLDGSQTIPQPATLLSLCSQQPAETSQCCMLLQVPFLANFVPRQRKALEAVALIRATTEELIAKCRAMVDAEEQVSLPAQQDTYVERGPDWQ